MELDNILALKEEGVNYDGALRRFSGSAQLYERFLRRFLEDTTFEQLDSALERGEEKDAFAAAHTFKGLTANLGMESLQDIVSQMVEFLRRGQVEEAVGMFQELKGKYDRICGIIDREC